MEGRLIVVGAPIGNRSDAPPRLASILGEADVIAAEDTRRLRLLCADLGVSLSASVISYYDAVEVDRIPALIDRLRSGSDVVLISDAGMPTVSDPGYRLVAAAVDADIDVTTVPGPSAVTAALAVSGLPTDRFAFEGFPPRRRQERRRWLSDLAREPRTWVFFESPRRLAETLADAVEVLGPDRRAAVARELTKIHEEVRRGGLADLTDWARDGVLGEITVVVAGHEGTQDPGEPADWVSDVADRVSAGLTRKEAIAEVARERGLPKRAVYQAVVEG